MKKRPLFIFLAILVNASAFSALLPGIKDDLKSNLILHLLNLVLVVSSMLLLRFSYYKWINILNGLLVFFGAVISFFLLEKALWNGAENKLIIPLSFFIYWCYSCYILIKYELFRTNLAANVFEKYHSKYADISGFRTIVKMRSCCFPAGSIVSQKLLREWIEQSKFNFCVVYDERQKPIGYWNCLLLTKKSYEKFKLGKLDEKSIDKTCILDYNNSIEYFVYVAGVCAVKKTYINSTTVLLSLGDHLNILAKTGRLRSVCAWSINSTTKRLLKKFDFKCESEDIYYIEGESINTLIKEIRRLREKMRMHVPNSDINEINILRRRL